MARLRPCNSMWPDRSAAPSHPTDARRFWAIPNLWIGKENLKSEVNLENKSVNLWNWSVGMSLAYFIWCHGVEARGIRMIHLRICDKIILLFKISQPNMYFNICDRTKDYASKDESDESRNQLWSFHISIDGPRRAEYRNETTTFAVSSLIHRVLDSLFCVCCVGDVDSLIIHPTMLKSCAVWLDFRLIYCYIASSTMPSERRSRRCSSKNCALKLIRTLWRVEWETHHDEGSVIHQNETRSH